MLVDAHQHFWNFSENPSDYVWMTDKQDILQRDLGPQTLIPLLKNLRFDGTVAVQAREMRKETDYLLDIARLNDFVMGVVGWLDLCDPAIEAELDAYAEEGSLKGLRMLIHDHPDPDFAISEAHLRGVSFLAEHGLTYDLLLRPQHLVAATALADSLPEQAFVIDHLAKPDTRSGWDEEWSDGIAEIAKRPNVYCKLSGMVTEADWTSWATAPFERYLDTALDHFGPTRLMIGSDWPVCTCAADYKATMGIVMNWAIRLSEVEQAAILGETCSQFYSLNGSSQ